MIGNMTTKINISFFGMKHLLVVLLILGGTVSLKAGTEPNKVIVSGQVLHVIYGGPVVDHLVYISMPGSGLDRGLSYYNEVYTNDEGYFYDTIFTNNQSGVVKVYTLDRNNKAYENISHFRFMDNIYSSILLNNFAIDAPYQFKPLQARFKYVQKAYGDRFRYRFFDQTTNPNIVSRLWDFGDGITSTMMSPEHVYSSPGLFQVSLTVTIEYYGRTFSNTITQLVYISPLESYHFGGHVFINQMPIDLGLAYLYGVDSSNNFIPIDTAYIDTLGYYYFYQVPVGKYVVKSEPAMESQYFGFWLPTYYGDELFWQEANPIQLSATSWEYNINLHNTTDYMPGLGWIEGKIEYDDLPRGITPATPAMGANIYLMDENDGMIMCSKANESGEFMFADMETKTYWVYPEITGVTAEKIQVNLSDEHPGYDSVHIVVFKQLASGIFDLNEQAGHVVQIFPNPASTTLTLEADSPENLPVKVRLMDMQGREIGSVEPQASGFNTLSMDVSSLKSGMYLLQLIGKQSTESQIVLINR